MRNGPLAFFLSVLGSCSRRQAPWSTATILVFAIGWAAPPIASNTTAAGSAFGVGLAIPAAAALPRRDCCTAPRGKCRRGERSTAVPLRHRPGGQLARAGGFFATPFQHPTSRN